MINNSSANYKNYNPEANSGFFLLLYFAIESNNG